MEGFEEVKRESGAKAVSKARSADDNERPVQPRRRRRSVIAPDEDGRPDRRGDILLSAEKLFAERGFHGVSVRDIAAEARVPLALVGYYFGKKAELFSTIFERRKSYFDLRVARIEAVCTDHDDGSLVEQIVRAWAEPALEIAAEKSSQAFSTLVARGLWDADLENRRAIERRFDTIAAAFLAAMGKALPGCDRGRLIWGYQYAVSSLLTHMVSSRVSDLSGGEEQTNDAGRREELIAFLAQGFRALAQMPGNR